MVEVGWALSDATSMRSSNLARLQSAARDPKGTLVLLQSGHPAVAIDATQCIGNSIASDSRSRRKRSPHGRLSPYELDALRVFNIFDTDAGSACRAASPVDVVTASASNAPTLSSSLLRFAKEQFTCPPDRLSEIVNQLLALSHEGTAHINFGELERFSDLRTGRMRVT